MIGLFVTKLLDMLAKAIKPWNARILGKGDLPDSHRSQSIVGEETSPGLFLVIGTFTGTGISPTRATDPAAEPQSITVFFKQTEFTDEPDANSASLMMGSVGWRDVSILPKGIFRFETSAGEIPTTGNADTDWGLAEAHETGIAIFVFPQAP